MTVADILDNLQHPKIVDALLLSPVFRSKLPAGTQLVLKPNHPVIGRPGLDPAALRGEKFTWAVVNERRDVKNPAPISGAFVNTEITDSDFDALDDAVPKGEFKSYIEDGSIYFNVDGKKVGPQDPLFLVFNAALEGGAMASATGMKIIVSNGPRWVVANVDPATGLTISPSYGKRADGSVIAEGRPTTTMYGALVSYAFETVINLDAKASLEAAKAAAAKK